MLTFVWTLNMRWHQRIFPKYDFFLLKFSVYWLIAFVQQKGRYFVSVCAHPHMLLIMPEGTQLVSFNFKDSEYFTLTSNVLMHSIEDKIYSLKILRNSKISILKIFWLCLWEALTLEFYLELSKIFRIFEIESSMFHPFDHPRWWTATYMKWELGRVNSFTISFGAIEKPNNKTKTNRRHACLRSRTYQSTISYVPGPPKDQTMSFHQLFYIFCFWSIFWRLDSFFILDGHIEKRRKKM